MSRHITEAICFKSGHEMISLDASKKVVEFEGKAIILDQQKSILCKHCGLSIDQIQNYHPKQNTKRKTVKGIPDHGDPSDETDL